MRILLVEDDKRIASFVKRGLLENSYLFDVTHDGEERLRLALHEQYVLIVLDIMLLRFRVTKVFWTLKIDFLENMI